MAASSNADIALGITLTTTGSTFNMQILDVSLSGLAYESVDVSHQGTTTARRFKPVDLYDPGEISMSVHFSDNKVPIDGTTGTFIWRWPSGTNWSVGGFVREASANFPLNDKITGDVTVKLSGPITATTS